MTDEGFDPRDLDDEKYRRSRGLLASDINRVCKAYVDGEIILDDGKWLTPYVAGKLLMEVDEIDEMPSSGAVNSVFKRWEKIGYGIFRKNPFAFLSFTPAGEELGLDLFLEEYRAQQKVAS